MGTVVVDGVYRGNSLGAISLHVERVPYCWDFGARGMHHVPSVLALRALKELLPRWLCSLLRLDFAVTPC